MLLSNPLAGLLMTVTGQLGGYGAGELQELPTVTLHANPLHFTANAFP